VVVVERTTQLLHTLVELVIQTQTLLVKTEETDYLRQAQADLLNLREPVVDLPLLEQLAH
jgi:hypothetical protein